MLLHESALRLCFAGSIVVGDAQQYQKALGVIVQLLVAYSRQFISFPFGLVFPIENKDRLDWRSQETQCAAKERAQDGILAP